MPIQGLAYFPGLNQIVDGAFSFTTGITPSMATLTIAPQANFTAQVGTLTFFDGQTTMQWPDARVDTNSFERNSSGLVWRLAIYDRRWKWQSTGGGGIILRGANLRNDDGTLITCTELSPQDAASQCLDAMGETGYDVGALPNDERPELLWDGGVPAQCLEELCEQFGCRVVLGLDNRVRICKVGDGQPLPETPDILTNSMALNLPGMPDKIAAVCAPDRFQVDLVLEAVGIENDGKGTLKLIDDLTYKPAGGWADVDLQFFDEITNTKARELAKKSVYRYYRVKFPIQVPGYTDTKGNTNATITRPWQVRLEDTQVEFVDEDMKLPEQQRRNKPAQIGGVYFNEDDGVMGNNVNKSDVAPYQTNPVESDDSDEDAEVDNHQWRLGSESQLGRAKDHYVVFEKPIYMNSSPSSFSMSPAKLVLRIACTLLDEYCYSPVRSYFWRDTGGGLGTQMRCELFADLQVWHYWDYPGGTVKDNTSDVKQDADYYIDGLLQEYQCTQPQTITYAGLKYVDLDGAIQHIHFKVGKTGCTTTISRNNEQLHRVQPLAYRKLMSKIKSGLREMKGHRPTLRSHKRG